MRQTATDVLRRSIRALPGHRNNILLGMASFLGRLSEDHPEVWFQSVAREGVSKYAEDWCTALFECKK